METVGHALPCFRHGTDYILNLIIIGSPASYAEYIFTLNGQELHILVLPNMAAYKSIHGCWITPHTARYCLIALKDIPNSNLGFTDKAGFSLLCYHKRRLFTNRTHVQRYRHSGFYTCSWYIIIH